MLVDNDELLRRMRAGDGPAWRWQRVQDLLTEHRRPDRWDDEPTVAAWRLCQAMTGSDGGPTQPTDCQHLVAAHALCQENGPRRWEIEARLLAGVPSSEIARRLQIDTGIVDAYVAAFFDVAGRTDSIGWLASYLPVGFSTPANPTESQIWLHVAAGGDGARAALDLLIADYLHRPAPAIPDRHQIAEDIRALVRFSTTPPSATPAYRRLLKQMWCVLSTRVHVRDAAQWEAVVQHLDCLELVAGAKPNRKPKHSDASASTAQQPNARQPEKPRVVTGGITATQERHRDDDRLAGIPIPAGAPAEFLQRLGALVNDGSGRFRWPQWAPNPVLAVA